MIIQSIHLENFRNYESLNLQLSPGVNVFFGNNGQGKTNILEAIYMCACARSHRTAKDSELILHNKDYYQIDLHYFSNYRQLEDKSYEEQIGIAYKQLQTVGNGLSKWKRILTKDTINIDKVVDFVGNFHAVIFAPEDLQIVKSGPADRRRFLDLLLSQIKTSYFKDLQDYSHILKQRNALLKSYREKGGSLSILEETELSIWDDAFAIKASKIIRQRFDLLDKINFYANNIHSTISNGLEDLRLEYSTISSLQFDDSEKIIEEKITNRLKQSRNIDVLKGYTSTGPHRDDFDIFYNEISLKTFGSQGQQRTAVLAMKIAELEIIRHSSKESPVLLLDDVMSELDANRRKQLVKSLQHTQIFLTCTDPDHLDKDWLENLNSSDISYYQVQSGHASPIEKNGENVL